MNKAAQALGKLAKEFGTIQISYCDSELIPGRGIIKKKQSWAWEILDYGGIMLGSGHTLSQAIDDAVKSNLSKSASPART